MSEYSVRFRDKTAEAVQPQPPTLNAGTQPAHLSLEIGHFYPEDLAKGPAHFEAYFRRVARYASLAVENYAERTGIERPRVSTAMMVDDYRKLRNKTPQEIIGGYVLPAAEAAGVRVDYLAREAACAEYADPHGEEKISPARILLARQVDVPVGGGQTDPDFAARGWVANGLRPGAAANDATAWQPAQEYGAAQHSIFMDVEIFSEDKRDGIIWACPTLASVWQLARLGDLHQYSAPAMKVEPVLRDEQGRMVFGEDWDRLPAVMQLHDDAAGFEAYSAFSALPGRYLQVEAAVRTIMNQAAPNTTTSGYIHQLAASEGLELPVLNSERIEYAFTGDL